LIDDSIITFKVLSGRKSMKVECPQCEEAFDIPDTYIGQPIKCSKCKRSFLASNTIIPDNNQDSLLAVVSFLIPLVGFIIGAILISKPDQVSKDTGGKCLRWALFGLIVGSIVTGIWFAFTSLLVTG
jgi:hypothetical protein